MNAIEKQQIDKYLDDKGLNHLKTKSFYKHEYQKVIDIIEMPFWQDKRFAHLLAPATFAASCENITAILNLSYWNDPKNLRFLSPILMPINCDSLVSRIELFKKLLLGDYITANSLRKPEEQIIALYKYIVRRRMMLIIDGRLNPLFNFNSSKLLKNHGINLEWLVEMERENKNGLS